jgi:hypothetical protein
VGDIGRPDVEILEFELSFKTRDKQTPYTSSTQSPAPAEMLGFFVARKRSQKTMTLTKTFNRPIKVATILRYAIFSAYQRPEWSKQLPDEALIKEWWYSRLANVYIRYWNLKPHCSTDEQITLDQFGGEDYRIALQQLLEERGIFEDADNTYMIDFAALGKERSA